MFYRDTKRKVVSFGKFVELTKVMNIALNNRIALKVIKRDISFFLYSRNNIKKEGSSHYVYMTGYDHVLEALTRKHGGECAQMSQTTA